MFTKEKLAAIKRIIIDLIIAIAILILFSTKAYEFLPMPIQLVALKALLVSMSIFHAHVVRKIMFPKIVWTTTKLTGGHYIVIAFYIIIPFGYIYGG